MTKVDEYRQRLRDLRDWEPFMLKASGLPGPRGNLELAQAFCLEASRTQILRFAGIGPADAAENTPRAFLAFCGVMGLGTLIVKGDTSYFSRLRQCASDPRWRIREAVAMGLQLVGDADMRSLIAEMKKWVGGNSYEQRAVAAALCEPRLLKSSSAASTTLQLLDAITNAMLRVDDRSDDGFRALRQGMAYCWSVAVASSPDQGKPIFEKWLDTTDPDIRWLLQQNLGKARLIRMDARWVQACAKRLSGSGIRTRRTPARSHPKKSR